MIMAEKKIFSIEVAMDEPMFHAIKGIAEADGVASPEMSRMLISTPGYLDLCRLYTSCIARDDSHVDIHND